MRRAAVGLAVCTLFVLSAALGQAQSVRPEVVATFPHDPQAFTQGLLLHAGRFYESTGLEGMSSLRRVVPETGGVERNVPLASDLFGEGLALVGERLIQLTWQDGIALVYDLDFNPAGSFEYTGEGWGLCYDGTRLVMSDGSSRLFFRDPSTFALLGDVQVQSAGTPVERLNELECVDGIVFANVWLTDTIVRIDPATGVVLDTIDASGLLSAQEAAAADVLNGIAFDAASGHFFLTGKLWPKLFEVRLDFGSGGSAGSGGSSGTSGGSGGVAGSAGAPDGGSAENGGSGGSGGSSATGGQLAGGTAGNGAAQAGLAGTISGTGAASARDSDSGCGCRLPATPVRSQALLWAAALAALVRRGSASRRRKLAR